MTKYQELVGTLDDAEKIGHFASVSIWAYETMQRMSPVHADRWLAMLEPLYWNNYISETEAQDLITELGGERFRLAEVENIAAATGMESERKPHYNNYALYVTMNADVSDRAPEDILASSIAELVSGAFIRTRFDI